MTGKDLEEKLRRSLESQSHAERQLKESEIFKSDQMLEIERLQESSQLFTKESREMNKVVTSLKNEIATLEEALSSKMEEIERARSEARKYKMSMDSLEVELQNSRSESSSLRSQLEMVSQEREDLREETVRLKDVINVRKREAAELQESEEKFKSEVERRDRSLRFMQGRLDALESENEQLQSEIVNYRKQLKNMEQENRTTSARCAQLEGWMTSLQTSRSDHTYFDNGQETYRTEMNRASQNLSNTFNAMPKKQLSLDLHQLNRPLEDQQVQVTARQQPVEHVGGKQTAREETFLSSRRHDNEAESSSNSKRPTSKEAMAEARAQELFKAIQEQNAERAEREKRKSRMSNSSGAPYAHGGTFGSSASQDQRPTPYMHGESEAEDAAVAMRTRSKFRDVRSAEERQTCSSEPPVQVEHNNSNPREPHTDDTPVKRSNEAKPVQEGFSFTSFQEIDNYTRNLQQQLLSLNQEKQMMESQLTKLVSKGFLKTGEERRHKLDLERGLEEVSKQIVSLRRQVRKLEGNSLNPKPMQEYSVLER
uniref:Uncharacterized protein n=1 Tax=Guillardia theta TaxID=55529 RepID=A0A7S4PHE4_GUITH|mmetsp:Transcript_51072/g.159590  ORF Transcript_51072/g.159590 Transcript_51072/m.159590 type:complete len:540 (+) Transcript_51072:34-1653(+)